LVIIAFLISVKIKNHKIGYYFTAIKENEAGAEMLGVNTLKYKILAFMISGALTSLGGVFHAQYYLFVDPYCVFDIMISIDMVLVAVVGGMDVPYGPIIGAAILQPIYEIVHAYLTFGAYGYDRIIIGFLLILIALFRPHGFAGLIGKAYKKILLSIKI
jgi:branched-chain amino acid transport system permease protein